MKNIELIKCPKCGKELIEIGNTVKCKNGHSYDVSKEGYLNLLLANKKNSLDPGDNKEQVLARKNFFEKEYFKPLVDEIKKMLLGYFGVLLDAGCGTGYYINNLRERFSCIGIDISKEAIKVSSKLTHETNIVSSIFDMPIKDNSIDVLLNIFAPKPLSEFKRVLKKDGIILEVIPSIYHMIELKNEMYENSYLNSVDDKKLDGFNLINESEVKYTIKILAEDIVNLIAMTPYNFSGKKFDKDTDVTLHFLIKIWKK